MDDLSASKSEARKLKTLVLCFHHLQLKGEASLGFSHITKEYYDKFNSQPHDWSYVGRKFQEELDYYLKATIPETSEPVS